MISPAVPSPMLRPSVNKVNDHWPAVTSTPVYAKNMINAAHSSRRDSGREGGVGASAASIGSARSLG